MAVVYEKFPVGWLKIVSEDEEIIGIDHAAAPEKVTNGLK